MLSLDHLVVAGQDLSEARSHVETALGVPLRKGGVHRHFATHNALLGLAEGLYLEAIAPDPAAPAPGRPRWFALDRLIGGARLSNWVCRVNDLSTALQSLPDGAGTPVALSRGNLRWSMAVPADGCLPCHGCFPAVIQWHGTVWPGRSLPDSGCRLLRLEVSHPKAAWLRQSLPLRDARIQFATGAAALRAIFATPSGLRALQ
ncbi:MAG: VOC family protein [Rhodobacteraceae bacterium]|nr:VOC family protein [Paracoccaceae bacterium]